MRVGAVELIVTDAGARQGEVVTLCLRPEALRIIAPGQALLTGEARLEGTVTHAEFIGALTRLDVELSGGTTLKVAVLDDPDSARNSWRSHYAGL